MSTRPVSDVRCPRCGEGVLRDISYDELEPALRPPKQAPESREVVLFTCGHEVEAGRLADAAADDPNVERRVSEETVQPIDSEGDAP